MVQFEITPANQGGSGVLQPVGGRTQTIPGTGGIRPRGGLLPRIGGLLGPAIIGAEIGDILGDAFIPDVPPVPLGTIPFSPGPERVEQLMGIAQGPLAMMSQRDRLRALCSGNLMRALCGRGRSRGCGCRRRRGCGC